MNGSDRFAWTSVPAKSTKPGADHERARPALGTARRSDEARRDERDAGHDREGGQRRAVAAQLAPLDRGRASAAQAAAAAPMPMTIGCARSSVPAAASVELSGGAPSGARSPPSHLRALTRQPSCRHATAAERVGLATLPCAATAGTILPCAGACSSSTTTAPSGQLRDSCSSGADSSSWPRPGAAQRRPGGEDAPSRSGARRRAATGLRRLRGRGTALPPRPGTSGHPDLEPRRLRFRGARRRQLRARLHSQRRALGSLRSKRCSHQTR